MEACILAGTDYSTGLKGVGIMTACHLLRQHGDIAQVLEAKGVSAALDDEIMGSLFTAYYAWVRTPQAATADSPLTIDLTDTAQVEHLYQVDDDEDEEFSTHLKTLIGNPPPTQYIADIARGLRSVTYPYELLKELTLEEFVGDDEEEAQLLASPADPTQSTYDRFLLSPVPRDRELTQPELAVVMALTILDVPGADEFARFEGILVTPQQQLENFLQLDSKPSLVRLKKFAATRSISVNQTRDKLYDDVLNAMKLEAQTSKFNVVDNKDGDFEKKRVIALIKQGIITAINCPHLVPPAPPAMDDPGWRFIRKEDLNGIDLFDLMLEWEARFHPSDAKHSGRLLKAARRVGARKAYYIRVFFRDEYMFVTFRTDRSRVKATRLVMITLKKNVGRTLNLKPSIVTAKCGECDVGTEYPNCTHITTCLVALVNLQIGTITAGDVGDDAKSWGGPTRTSHVPVQSIQNISFLTRHTNTTGYTGLLPETKLESVMNRFINLLQERAHPGIPPTLVELHSGRPIVRKGTAPAQSENQLSRKLFYPEGE